MRALVRTGSLVVMIVLAAATARAAVLLDISSALSASDPLQIGRLSRNAIPQDWSGGEPFPGVINPAVSYRYHTYAVNVGQTPFVQVIFDSVSIDTFISAYDTAYLPGSNGAPNFGLNANWLGDAGSSGNFFGVDPLFFQVLAQTNHVLVLVVAETIPGGGVGDPFKLTVEGYVDSNFTDVPEPASLLLGGLGFGVTAWRRRRG